VLVKEALDHALFQRFLFVDANFGPDVVLAIGAERLEGQMGTIPIAAGDRLPGYATVHQELKAFAGAVPKQSALAAYDAAICLCLAAERAGSTDGEALRDALYEVCGKASGKASGSDTRIDAGAAGVTEALAAVRSGRDIDFDGATSTIDWDAAGDVTRGFVGVYRFQEGSVVLVDRVAFDSGLPLELSPPDTPPTT
jgi:ABC-type branched-subunit amino acid transport system substrate-binding protein